jgi:single-strand DNA-binding protein
VPLNVAVLQGVCSRPAEVRELPSGSTLALVQLTVRADGARATSVPVAVWDPPAWVADLDVGDEVVALGRVRRRFFGSAGGTASRVEVEADVVARARDRRRVASVVRRATVAIGALEG